MSACYQNAEGDGSSECPPQQSYRFFSALPVALRATRSLTVPRLGAKAPGRRGDIRAVDLLVTRRKTQFKKGPADWGRDGTGHCVPPLLSASPGHMCAGGRARCEPNSPTMDAVTGLPPPSTGVKGPALTVLVFTPLGFDGVAS
ncbi:hypothetical protein SKAU_G00215850 [Synaphobranchus kaupii]|uniref:Uncharacterized protein n=1 Tax=Synaphobranchus kaupii TaxID=118154 RepID=A0A9Q1IVI5_SYNKA|nr:hypothetical protein SKAU_G00215850 [Synaphobranchus kaupii]